MYCVLHCEVQSVAIVFVPALSQGHNAPVACTDDARDAAANIASHTEMDILASVYIFFIARRRFSGDDRSEHVVVLLANRNEAWHSDVAHNRENVVLVI